MHPSYVALYDRSQDRWVQPMMTKYGLSNEYMSLLKEKPQEIRENAPCPDCGADMYPQVGRFGRYYRCSRNRKFGCVGACSAKLDGSYTGKPAHSSLRKLRHQILLLKEQKTQEGVPVLELLAEKFAGVDLRESDAAQCKETIDFLVGLVPLDCLDHILGNTFDPLDEPVKDRYILYTALGKEQQTGPYTAQEVTGHLDDIAGYEGVTNARIVCADSLNKKKKTLPGKSPKKSALDMILEDDDAPTTDSSVP